MQAAVGRAQEAAAHNCLCLIRAAVMSTAVRAPAACMACSVSHDLLRCPGVQEHGNGVGFLAVLSIVCDSCDAGYTQGRPTRGGHGVSTTAALGLVVPAQEGKMRTAT